MITVLLVDDQSLLRAGFRVLLDGEDDIRVVGEAGDGAAALERIEALMPDIVLMDIRMPGMDGIEATRRITRDQRFARTRVIVLTTFDLDEYVFEALRQGASGFLLKNIEPLDLIRGVRAVHAGDALLSPGVTRQLISEYARRSRIPPAHGPWGELTDREAEVVRLAAAGLGNDEIATRLVLSPATAKTHVNRAMVKLGIHDRAQLVVLAYESGLVRPGWTD
jgi:DNA-binding NarL/FixJ family response regulator